MRYVITHRRPFWVGLRKDSVDKRLKCSMCYASLSRADAFAAEPSAASLMLTKGAYEAVLTLRISEMGDYCA